MKVTAYFAAVRIRPDRAVIRDEWIERAIATPLREHVQADGRIRRWIQVPEMENRYPESRAFSRRRDGAQRIL